MLGWFQAIWLVKKTNQAKHNFMMKNFWMGSVPGLKIDVICFQLLSCFLQETWMSNWLNVFWITQKLNAITSNQIKKSLYCSTCFWNFRSKFGEKICGINFFSFYIFPIFIMASASDLMLSMIVLISNYYSFIVCVLS